MLDLTRTFGLSAGILARVSEGVLLEAKIAESDAWERSYRQGGDEDVADAAGRVAYLRVVRGEL